MDGWQKTADQAAAGILTDARIRSIVHEIVERTTARRYMSLQFKNGSTNGSGWKRTPLKPPVLGAMNRLLKISLKASG
jgi:hypothetical protein